MYNLTRCNYLQGETPSKAYSSAVPVIADTIELVFESYMLFRLNQWISSFEHDDEATADSPVKLDIPWGQGNEDFDKVMPLHSPSDSECSSPVTHRELVSGEWDD